MIYTVTLNPTLDKTLSVPQLRAGEFHRAAILRTDLSGKGINVSRALKALGIPSKTLGFVGGRTGQAFQVGLQEEGFDIHFIDVGGETRSNITLLDESAGVYTKINEPGPTIGPAHVAALQAQVEAWAGPGDYWTFSGSMPPGAPLDLYAQLIAHVQAKGAYAFLDTSEAALRASLSAHPYGLKPNSDEAAQALGRPVLSDNDHCQAAQKLREMGVQVVLLTRGEDGLVLAMGDDVLMATPPPVEARSPVAAGDSALAGLLWALSEGCDAAEAARRAVACGTGSAMQEGSGVANRALIEDLRSRVKLVRRCE
ncbi:MAG: 1-phosphofructokinase [Chloroflexi bacterium]|nr:1-phosphofructokinase [Chloroflexota bacterium]